MTLRQRPAQCARFNHNNLQPTLTNPGFLTSCVSCWLYYTGRQEGDVMLGPLTLSWEEDWRKCPKQRWLLHFQLPSLATCGIWSPSRKSTVTIKRTHFQPYLWRSVQRRLWFISNSERDAWIVVRNRLWHRSTGPVKAKSGFGPTILPSTGNHFPAKNQTFWV